VLVCLLLYIGRDTSELLIDESGATMLTNNQQFDLESRCLAIY